MPKPIKPTIPEPPLRSNPATFSRLAEIFLLFQPEFADYLNAIADFVDQRSTDSGGGISETEARDVATALIATWAQVGSDDTIPVGKFGEGVITGAKIALETITAAHLASDVSLGGAETASSILTKFLQNDGTNIFTDGDKTKLDDIEARATADQTGREITALLEALPLSARLRASAIRDLPTGRTGGGLTSEHARGLIADWAEQGNDDKIPLIKFTLSSTAEALGGVDLTSLMTPLTTRSAMNAFVSPWARVGNTAKLPVDKIADRSVTGSKLARSAITGTNLANNTITERKLAIGSVTTFKIVDRAVTRNKIADDAVGSGQIEDGSITAVKLASGVSLGGATNLTSVNQTLSDHTRFINRNRDDVATVVTRADALEEVDQALTTRVDEDRVRLNALETREPEDETVVNRLRKIIGGGAVIDMGAVNEFINGTADRYELENKRATAGYPPQSFCVDPYTDELFTLNRRDTSRSAGTVNVSIFDAGGVRKPEAKNSTVNLVNIGHSHLSVCWDRGGNRKIWTAAANTDPDKFNYVRSNRFFSIRTSLTLSTEVLYKLFTGSTDFCIPACSLDGRYLVAAGQKTGSKVDIKVFDLQKLLNNGAGDYSDDHFTSFELSGTFGLTSPLRGLACDGTYIYILAGNTSSIARKKMLVYNMDGVFIHEISDFKVGKSKSLLDSASTPSYAPQGLGWVYYSGKPYLGAVIHSGSSTARKARIWVMGLPYSERSVSKTWEIFDPREEDGVIWQNARANIIQTPFFEPGFDYRIDGEMSISASGSIFVEAFYHIQQAWVTVEVLSNVSLVGRVGIHMHWHNPNSDAVIKTGFLEWFQRSQLISKNNPSAKRTIAMTAVRGSLERINKIRFRVSDDDESFNTGLLHMTRSRVDG